MDFNIDHLAALSRIQLEGKEKEKIKEDLHKILDYVEQINELDLTNVEPTSHVLDIENVFRDDEVGKDSAVALKVIKYLPKDAKEDRFFKVPKVIESIE